MLLRSSSTPVLGSLLSSFSESPNHHHRHHYQPEVVPHTAIKHPPTTIPQSLNKISFHQAGSQNYTFSCTSSPISPSVSEFSVGTRCSSNGFRRAQSEGNLEGLANASSNIDEFSLSNPIKKFSGRSSGSLLETIPSFSFHNSTSRYKDDEDSEYDDEDEEEQEEEREEIMDNEELFKNIAMRDEERFQAAPELHMEKRNFGFNPEMRYEKVGFQKEIIGESPQMFLARGLGVTTGIDINFGSGGGPYASGGGGGGGGGGGSGSSSSSSGGGDGNENGLEEHYKRMVQDNPKNPLFLRNYAQFLYQTKQDLQGADEYYSRAILIDPKDGEILSQYAKLVWELDHDIDRAAGYFERAVHAASEESHVHAAYASFLWEIEEDEDEDEDEDETLNDPRVLPPLLHRGPVASATA